ncbi:TIGR03086 family metal-binding protein [Actinomadura atramentaria]|uniref:TIGR03086 family metal-binding protein n=1 Tax=Actinomadura atramentaria TaxID=1990 RepID=UPI000375D7A1|nr:TIGR03086 family metal-binding protein [Actinomadura atramentaria]
MVPDLRRAADRLATLTNEIPDDLLTAPTPCPGLTVGDLLEHVDGFSLAFAAAARKAVPPGVGGRRAPDASRLTPDWRGRIPAALDDLVAAWRDPAAWTGDTRVGGVDLPGATAGLFALDELVVHGWDLARAAELPFAADDRDVEACARVLTPAPGEERTGDAFGPVVPVPPDASPLDRLIGLSGRNPSWTPPRG